MTTFALQSRTSTSFSNQNKNTTTFDLREKAGAGWDYDEANLNYDSAIDPDSGLPVYYDSVGSATSWSNQNKS